MENIPEYMKEYHITIRKIKHQARATTLEAIKKAEAASDHDNLAFLCEEMNALINPKEAGR